ncbi:RraA family protein [Pseudoalteromonas phenolica]|nr:RraA family protein [Pseudoalteromonas phenolica]MBE0356005.1 hypothetical protein [Pseudoalteromonas phenolica O-BC30]RXE94674.1 RraA family protein [Pseudoalteromonas phenolica O-BC30]
MNKYLQLLEKAYSGIVFDVLRSFGHPNCVLPDTIRPLNLEHSIVGPAFTVEGQANSDLTEHESLTQWCQMLSKAPKGHIVICQPNDGNVAHMGELSSETFVYKGVTGYIVDGGCRDSGFITKTGFPVWSKYYTPRDVVGCWQPTAFNQPITIGGVEIKANDIIFADRDGVVVIPSDLLEQVANKVDELIHTENKVRTAILSGTDPVDAYLKYGKF